MYREYNILYCAKSIVLYYIMCFIHRTMTNCGMVMHVVISTVFAYICLLAIVIRFTPIICMSSRASCCRFGLMGPDLHLNNVSAPSCIGRLNLLNVLDS